MQHFINQTIQQFISPSIYNLAIHQSNNPSIHQSINPSTHQSNSSSPHQSCQQTSLILNPSYIYHPFNIQQTFIHHPVKNHHNYITTPSIIYPPSIYCPPILDLSLFHPPVIPLLCILVSCNHLAFLIPHCHYNLLPFTPPPLSTIISQTTITVCQGYSTPRHRMGQSREFTYACKSQMTPNGHLYGGSLADESNFVHVTLLTYETHCWNA